MVQNLKFKVGDLVKPSLISWKEFRGVIVHAQRRFGGQRYKVRWSNSSYTNETIKSVELVMRS